MHVPEGPVKVKTSILLYAVASNNLSSSFYDDLKEMKEGLLSVDLSQVDYYLYAVTNGADSGPHLCKAAKNDAGDIEFRIVKSYDRETSSVDPARISEVIGDYALLSDADTRGLILWSHSTAWSPSPSTLAGLKPNPNTPASGSRTPSVVPADIPEITWWGQDINEGQAEYCDLPDLASAIPDRFFDFIWFDCCYMSSIEVIYEMKDKAATFVAYPTEVLAEGAPYNLILPLIAIENPNLVTAADAMADYYLSGNKIFTVAVIDPSPIEEIAEMAQKAIPGTRVRPTKLLKYSRGGYYYYDFRQYTSEWGKSLGDEWDNERFLQLMDQLVIYKNCGTRLFSGANLDRANYGGISCCYFTYDPEDDELMDDDQRYYIYLQWFKRVFAPFWPAMNQ